MFRKDCVFQPRARLKKSQIRALREKIKRAYGDEVDLDVLMSTSSTIELGKVRNRKDLIYFIDDEPCWFDPHAFGRLCPTVITLWKAPNLLPRIDTNMTVFNDHIRGGADLMLPGVYIPTGGPGALREFRRNDFVAVCVRGLRAPVAVGYSVLGRDDVVERFGANAMRGRLVEVTHCFTDFLWAQGSSLPLPMERTVDARGQGGGEGEGEGEEKNGNAKQGESERGEAAEKEEEEEEVDPRAAMDELLDVCLLLALKTRIAKADLPMLASRLTPLVLACCPDGETVNVKHSRHKKFSVFLRDAAARGLIRIVESEPGRLELVGICRDHEQYRAFRPTEHGYDPSRSANDDNDDDDHAHSNTRQPFELREVFRLPRRLAGILGLDPNSTVNLSDARTALNRLVAERDLTVPDKPQAIHVDDELRDILQTRGGREVLKRDLAGLLQRQLKPFVQVSRGQLKLTRKGTPRSITISSKSRGGSKKKAITTIRFVEDYLLKPEEVARDLRLMFAASTTVNQMAGKDDKYKEVLVQGDRVKQSRDYFLNDCGVPTKFVRIQ